MRPPRIWILRGGALGDFIVTLPVLSALRKRWPDSYIELVGYPHFAELARVAGLADAVTSLYSAGIARFYGLRPEIPPAQRDHVRSFDLIFHYLHDPDGTVRQNLEQAGAQFIVSASPMVRERHAVDHFLKTLECLAIYESGAAPRLELPPAEIEAGRARLARYTKPFVIHPGSGSPRKNWPVGRFIELARRLRNERGWTPVFLLGEADEEAHEGLARNAPELVRLEGLSIREVAQILAAADAYLGNDSGISHLAAAVGIPVTVLFGPSDPALWAPRGNVVVVREPSGEMGNLPLETVWQHLP